MLTRFLSFLDREPARPVRFPGQLALYWIGLFVFLYYQTGAVVHVYADRSLPPEPDDSYGYMIKAAQLEDCFLQTCPALQDLRKQASAPTSDLSPRGAAFFRDRLAHRTLEVYHPLHSVILSSIHTATGSWEQAYRWLSIAGSIFLALALAAWLQSLVGPGPAGLALLLLSNVAFLGHGVLRIVPSNLALGIFLATWALVTNLTRKHTEWLLLLGSLELLTMHPVGRLYTLALLGVYWHTYRSDFTRRRLLAVGLVLACLLLIAFGLPRFVDRPLLGPLPGSYSLAVRPTAAMLAEEIFTDLYIAKESFDRFGNLPGSLLLFLYGYVHVGKAAKSALFLLGGLLLASLGALVPGYPGTLFERLWLPAFVLAVGCIAAACAALARFALEARRGAGPPLAPPRFRRLLGPAAAGFLVFNLLASLIVQPPAFRAHTQLRLDLQNYRFDTTQAGYLTAQGPDCGDVLYTHEHIRDFFLTHGALACGAVDYHSVLNTAEADEWIWNNPDLKYVVTLNPISALDAARQGGLALGPGDRLELTRGDTASMESALYLLVENRDARAALLEIVLEDRSSETMQIDPGEKWVSVPSGPRASIDYWQITSDSNLQINSIRLGLPADGRNWPWDEGLVLTFTPQHALGASQTINFEVASLFEWANALDLEVVQDHGNSLILQIGR